MSAVRRALRSPWLTVALAVIWAVCAFLNAQEGDGWSAALCGILAGLFTADAVDWRSR